MQLKYLPLASLMALVAADIVQFESDLASMYESIALEPSVRSLWEAIFTFAPAQQSQLYAAEQAFATQTYGPDFWNAAPSAYSAFPSPFNSYFLSVWTVEQSLAIKDGVATDFLGSLTVPSLTVPTVTAPVTASATGGSAGGSVGPSVTGSGSASGGSVGGSATGSPSANGGSGSGSGSTTQSAGTAGTTSPVSTTLTGAPAGIAGSATSTGGAAAPTGILLMGAVAGMVGGVAALL